MTSNAKPALAGLTESQRESVLERFREKVQPDRETGCLNWTGVLRKGYGRIRIGRRILSAHRVAWEMKYGPAAPGQVIRHGCNNPGCVNPEHLMTGTQQENMNDMTEGHRGHSRLTNREAVMVTGFAIMGLKPKETAEELGASVRLVRAILKGERRSAAIDFELAKEKREAGT